MNTQNGRSMVEMLGVLAIIGVLSVGAIAGYGKAMFKYRLNKQAEQLNTIINTVARNVHSFNNLKQNTELTETFIKMGEIPKEMIEKYDHSYVYDVFKIGYLIFFSYTESRIILYIYPPLDTESNQNLEICRNILVTAKENSDNITRLETLSGWGTEDSSVIDYVGDKLCDNNRICLKNMTLDNIYDICTKHIGKTSAHLKIKWDF